MRDDWQLDGIPFRLHAETWVMITPPADGPHAVVARDVLDSPDALLTLVLGGDHLADGIAAIHEALAHPVLRPTS